MDTLSYKTVSANKATANKEWVVVDAKDQVLGRFAVKVAKLLRGKYKTNFTPHVDCGDNVIVINADKVVLTGKKWTDRVYLRYINFGETREFDVRIDFYRFFAEVLRRTAGHEQRNVGVGVVHLRQKLDGLGVPLHGAYVQVERFDACLGGGSFTCFGEVETNLVMAGKDPRDFFAVAEIRGAPLAQDKNHLSNFSRVIPG